jgi:putative transcriptional regulator
LVPIRNRIQMFRDVHGIDQQKLADNLGITRTHLSKLENQRFSPGPGLMERVCNYFGKELGEIFYIEKGEEVDGGCRKQKG